MNIIIMGIQGSGKGTQAKFISEKYSIPHISTGDLLRNYNGKLKEKINSIINSGYLIPDNLMLEILKERLSKEDSKSGFILDGFPRNIEQAKSLGNTIDIDALIEIIISDEEVLKRLKNRLSCKCGSVYNKETNPPKEENICDKCHSKLEERKDDNEESIRKRIKVYHEETEKIIGYYPKEKIIRVNGNQEIEKVKNEISKKIEEIKN